MFVGNDSQVSKITYTITNCVNSGTIRATYVDNSYIPNWYVATGGQKTYVVNGTEYAAGTLPNFMEDATVTTTGTVANGPVDTGLALNRNADGTFTISPATIEGETVDHYVVSLGVYAVWQTTGTNRFYVSETVAASDAMTTELKYLSFVDQTWKEANSEASEGTLAGNTILTLDDTSYYLVTGADETLNGNVKAPQMASVSAYDADGRLLASVPLAD